MKYRVEITDRNNQSSGVITLESRNDEVAVLFAGTIANTVKNRRVALWAGDRLVQVYPIPRLANGAEAAD